jgi:DNA (cytosine-5)-methyltransferase 1
MPVRRVPLLSLFAGAGIFDFAFEQNTRFRTALAVEIDQTFATTMRHNIAAGVLGVRQVECTDVTQMAPRSVIRSLGIQASDVGIIGGPPCQSFSSMGQKKGVRDSRGKLMFEFARWVREIKPRFFVIENVPNFRTVANGTAFRKLLREVGTEKYALTHAVLNAAEYGAPTTRKRLFIVGVRDRRAFRFPDPSHGNPKRPLAAGVRPWVTTADALRNLPTPAAKAPGVPQWHVVIAHTAAVTQRFRSVAPGGYDYVRKRSRLALDQPSKSLVAGNWQGARFHIHPCLPRELTNREAARVQGIPDCFVFAGDRVAVARQIANAVPVQLGEAVANAIWEQYYA